MNVRVLLGLISFVCCVRGQQYGPLPPRPQQFAGATLVQPSRGNVRQRSGASRIFPEAIRPAEEPAIRSRRPQPSRRIKAQPPQAQVPELQKTNLVDDGAFPFPNKLHGPVAPVQLQPQLQAQTAKFLTPRPVEEEIIEDEDVSSSVGSPPMPTTFSGSPRAAYLPGVVPAPPQPQLLQPGVIRPTPFQSVQPVQFTGLSHQGRQPARQQARLIQTIPTVISRPQAAQTISSQVPMNSEPVIETDQYFRQVSARPPKKQEILGQQILEREPVRQQSPRQPETVRQQPARAQPEYSKPSSREPHGKANPKEKKPVVQTIRKYHEENEDGSITWGYENDDGSFKEETIGVDCVTRGKYGYYDPDGVKREYSYQTGIPCEKVPESEAAASDQGFVDYTNNKYVLPNGDEIDLEVMVKNRARKPVAQYRN